MAEASIAVDQRASGVIPIYSVAKIFTAAAALLRFDEDAVIGTLTAVPAHLRRLRLGDLLAHRSGLGDYGAWPDYREAVAARETAWSPEVVLDRVELGEPGAFRYSNPGYLLVRRALEDVQGDTYFGLLERLVLRPLGVEAFPFATPLRLGLLRSFNRARRTDL
jgi:D-alanyl-D-alanine carboxypeptidase